MKWRSLVLATCVASASMLLHAQETRATLTGHVADSTGARVPGAAIAIKNMDTGVLTNARSNSAGDFNVPFLQPGRYSVTVTMTGFQTYTHTNLVLQTEQTMTENVTLPNGSVNQTVTVEGGTPLVDVADSSTGQTLTAEQVEELPSNGRSPLGFAHLEYGVVAKGKHSTSQTTPFGYNNADDFSIGGGASSSNELLLNGVPNMQDSSRTAGFSPELDAVDAVRVDLFSANAAMGDSSGGVVNITTKSGTNQFHGTVSEYYGGSRPLTAKPYFTPAGTKTSSTHYNQFGATIGGPLSIPKVYNGRDKAFFFYSLEGYNGSAPATVITTVPTAAERNGDFSALLALGTTMKPTSYPRCKGGPTSTYNPYQLYDPNSAYADTACPGQYLRNPINGNNLTQAGFALSPIAQAYLKMVPLPNYTGSSTTADGQNNYFASDPTVDDYLSHEGRFDYNFSTRNRFSFEAHESSYKKSQSNIFFDPLTGSSTKQNMLGGFVEDVHNFSPSTSLDLRLSLTRSENTSNPNSIGISPTTLGYASYLAANSTALAIPGLTFSDNGASIPSLSGNPGSQAFFDTIQFFGSFNKVIGRHSLKFGPDIRANKDSTLSPGAANGGFSFSAGNGSSISFGSTAPAPLFGGAYSFFDLGLPTGGSQAIATRYQYNNWYFAGFAQDDWKARPNFTISVGIRLEHETPITESQNHMLVGFDPTASNAVSAGAVAAYAKAPSTYLPASAFSPTGALIYATSNNRSSYATAPLYASPRVGFSYAPEAFHGTLAIRGGFAIYLNPFNDYNFGQNYGYTATTAFVQSYTPSGIPTSTLADPFDPNVNPIQQPIGNSLGGNVNLGAGIVFINPHPKVPYVEKATLDVQKQFGKDWLVEIGGFSTHSVHLSYSNQVSSTPLLPYLSRSNYLDPAANSFFATQVANPFYGLYPSVYSNVSLNKSKTIGIGTLLQQYPQYSNVTEQLVTGQNASFNALNARLTKRMSHGLQFDINYEWSRLLGAQSQLNTGGPLSYGETTSDFPQHLSVTAIYELPFGRGKAFLHNSHWLDEAVGGWRVTGIYQALSGTPLQWGKTGDGGLIYTGNWHDFNNHPHQTIGTSFNTTVFDRTKGDQPNSNNYRVFPMYALRSDATNNVDLSVLKNFTLGERFVLQPRVDAFNALNHVQFTAANTSPTSGSFGVVNGQQNASRTLQGGLHILF